MPGAEAIPGAEALPGASGEIIVHTDANAWLAPDALRHITAPFSDPRVGCVVGELVYTNAGEPAVRGGEGLYWRYENFLKECESRLGRTITANGGIYALRRSLFEPLPQHIAGDAADPLRIAARGYVTLFERRALARERASSSFAEEFGRKVRIMTQGIAACIEVRGLLFPPKPLLAFIYFSHKVLRWLAPLFLMTLFAVNLAAVTAAPLRRPLVLSREIALASLGAQVFFYAVALWGVVLANRANRTGAGTDRSGGSAPGAPARLAVTAGYYLTVNAAAFLALVNLARGVRLPMWEKSASTRRE